MTIGEANAVNVLLTFLLDECEDDLTLKTKLRDVGEAGALLAAHAYKALYAGCSEADWRRKWKAIRV